MAINRQRRDRSLDSENATGEAPAVARASLTQRHVARPDEVQRATDHAILDAAWGARPVQLSRDEASGLDDTGIQAAAAHGINGAGGTLPYLDTIQRSFGEHDVSGINAHVGGAAKEASQAMNANAYATGNDVAFAEQPSLFLVAHEAAHVVQQRAGVQLQSAVGQVGDSYEQNADAVAARVVAGESAADLLGPVAGGGGTGVQLDRFKGARHAPLADPPPPTDARKASETISPGNPPKADEKEEKEGASFLPVIDKVNATIAGVKKLAGVVQELTHNNTNIKRISLQPMHAKGEDSESAIELKRVHNHRMAQKVCDQAFEFANNHGVDLKNLDSQHRVKKVAAPPAPLPPGSVFLPKGPQGPTPAHAPAGGIKEAGKEVFDETDVAKLVTSMERLDALAAGDLKDSVDLELKKMVKSVGELPEATFWWDGDGNHGDSPMTGDDLMRTILGSAHGAYGVMRTAVSMSHVPGGAVGGMPADVKYFQLKPTEEQYKPQWITGGGIDIEEHEDVSITAEAVADPDLYKPGGAYRMKSTWKWDESTSLFDCAITNLGISKTLNMSPKLHGETPDDGWV